MTATLTRPRTASPEEIRAQFPALERRAGALPVAYFDGPGGTQVPRSVADAMTDYLFHHNANTHWAYPSSAETDAIIMASRGAMADFLNASPNEIAFGLNMTTITFHLARALGRALGAGDEIVITELDHHANVAPWRALERERGVTIRVAKLDTATGQLDWADLERHLSKRTRVLAIGAASNALGTITNVARAVKLARAASPGVITFVDAVHYAPHSLVDVRAIDCDYLACSAYKFYGPHIGILYGKHELLSALDVPRLDPAPNEAPERLETGTQDHEGIAGAAAAVDFLAVHRRRRGRAPARTARRRVRRAARAWRRDAPPDVGRARRDQGRAPVRSAARRAAHPDRGLHRRRRAHHRRGPRAGEAGRVRIQRRLLRQHRGRTLRPAAGRVRAYGMRMLHHHGGGRAAHRRRRIGGARRALMRRTAIALAAVAVLAPFARTQGRDSAQADTSHADSTKVHRLAPVITSTRLGEADEQVPSQVDRVNVKDLPPGSAPAAEALLALPGVSAFDDQGTPAQPTLEIRGFNLSPVVGVPQGVSVFLDGVRVNEPDAQELNFDLLPMDAVKHAQLIRGPATLYGKNTLAGALVLFTERGSDIPELSGELSAGSFGAYDAHVTASGTHAGFDGYVTAAALNETGWRDDTGIRERSLFMNLGHKTDSTDLAFTVLYAHDRILEAGSLPASWLAVDPKLNFTAGDFFEPELWHLSLRGERPLGEGRLRGALFWRHNDIQQFNVNVDAPSSDAFVTNASFGLTGEWSAPLTWWSRPVALTVGAELARNDVRETLYAELTADTSVHLPPECAASGLCADIKVPETDAGAFAQAVMSLTPKLSLTAAARFDWVRLPFEDLYDSANSATSTYTHLSPRIGATLAVSPTVRGYASIGGGFRAPAPVELGCASPSAPCPLPYALGDDPALAPVTLTSYEIGADWEPHGGSTLEAALFRSDVTDEIVFVASNANAGYFENIPRTRRQGVEISGTLVLPLGLRAARRTHTSTRRTRARCSCHRRSPCPTPRAPATPSPCRRRTAMTLSFGATRVIGDGALDAEIAMNAVSTQYLRGDDANAEAPLPGYAVWRMRLAYQRPHIGVTAKVTESVRSRVLDVRDIRREPRGPAGRAAVGRGRAVLFPCGAACDHGRGHCDADRGGDRESLKD